MKNVYVNELLMFNRTLYTKLFNECWEQFFRETLGGDDDWMSHMGTFLTDTMLVTTDFFRVNIEHLFRCVNTGLAYTPVYSNAEYEEYQLDYDYCGMQHNTVFPPHEICEMVLTFAEFLYNRLTSISFMADLNTLLRPVADNLLEIKRTNGFVGYWSCSNRIFNTVWEGTSSVRCITQEDFDVVTGVDLSQLTWPDNLRYFYWQSTPAGSFIFQHELAQPLGAVLCRLHSGVMNA